MGILATGFLLSWLFNRQLGKHRVYAPLAFFLWIAVLLLAQRVAPLPRIWFFALPLFLVCAAGGLLGGLAWLAGRVRLSDRVVSRAQNLALLLLILTGVYQLAINAPRLWSAPPGPVEQTALFLKERLSDEAENETLVVIGSTDGPSLMYYFDRHGLSRRYLLDEVSHDTQIIYVITNTGLGESPEAVLSSSQRLGEMPEMLPDNPIQRFGSLTISHISYKISP
jgi:hypothetical protein